MFAWFKKFCERLAETNKKEFGVNRLDCCDLNNNTIKKEQHEEKENNSCH